LDRRIALHVTILAQPFLFFEKVKKYFPCLLGNYGVFFGVFERNGINISMVYKLVIFIVGFPCTSAIYPIISI